MSRSPAGPSGGASSLSMPAPVPDEDSSAYWAALREHRILLQRCASCGEIRSPRMPGCPQCGSADFHDVDALGTGSLYSWIVISHPLGGLAREQLPRTIATVELAEGCRMLGRLLSQDTVLAIDLPVEAVFVDHDDWTELAFSLAGQR